ncbi:hypothetical protein NEUTE1DRAFT_116862 [Neurospora tetrasperma FGSC 2508]|uniref:Uncharacterized protein n=1 Tax=Neurospora tetrasperma (strain FGSC 2508 / ATCC MYA-4615 / P0657) TaxID=510951 RepID=F8ML87_NEUT8|nr:uncharacterized protein NEUTE1DRAFT_116862 [Neurospora tetrasperma FGSC 2508]EGO57562.1 hypothetical protein NEUTE1DRAFT_116862 [Neurospora tetrasperma FGSC 2508]EGZ72178.1 hypothetical protein NEUTE2DRAFT_144745 [Neurospora tetrasperma FGSC 2509]
MRQTKAHSFPTKTIKETGKDQEQNPTSPFAPTVHLFCLETASLVLISSTEEGNKKRNKENLILEC